ncbi:MAG: hypothetical protein ACJ8BW_29890 [Ktedonobacteraceae bacterium]
MSEPASRWGSGTPLSRRRDITLLSVVVDSCGGVPEVSRKELGLGEAFYNDLGPREMSCSCDDPTTTIRVTRP